MSTKADKEHIRQVGGDHYDADVHPVDLILANDLGFCEGSAIKYICRYKRKNGLQDLLKARDYINRLISHHYGDEALDA